MNAIARFNRALVSAPPEAPHHEARAAIRSAAIVYTPVSLDNSKSWLDNTPADVRETASRSSASAPSGVAAALALR